MTSLSCHHSRVWIDYVGDNKHMAYVIPPSSMSFCMKMSEKRKSTSPRAVFSKLFAYVPDLASKND